MKYLTIAIFLGVISADSNQLRQIQELNGALNGLSAEQGEAADSAGNADLLTWGTESLKSRRAYRKESRRAYRKRTGDSSGRYDSSEYRRNYYRGS